MILQNIISPLRNIVRNHILAFIVFVVLLFISFFVVDDYGISWDELMERGHGRVSYEYISGKSDRLLTYPDRDYGVGFTLPCYAIEQFFKLEEFRQYMLFRHMFSHILFLISALYLYFIGFRLFKNKNVALIGMLFYLLMPRFYAHSFFNPKDLPFTSFFVISLYYLYNTFQKKSFISYIIFGFVSGFLVNFRIMGIMLLLIFLSLAIFDWITTKKHSHYLINIPVFLVCYFIGIVVLWPFLWSSPFRNLITGFENMSAFRWNGNILMYGKLVPCTSIPWSYIPSWLFITTPIVYLFFFIIGCIHWVKVFIDSPKQFLNKELEINVLVPHIIAFGSIISVVVLKSVLYDSWRQMFFIYPSMIIIAMYGVHQILTNGKKYFKIFTWILIVTGLLNTGINMIRLHPHQQVYFNTFIPKNEVLQHKFEMDYWGASMRQGFEMILEYDTSQCINVFEFQGPGKINYQILKDEEKERLKLVKDIKDADYCIGLFRKNNRKYLTYDLPNEPTFGVKQYNAYMLGIWELGK